MLILRALTWRGLGCFLAVALAGCSDPYSGRMELSGTITLEGQPLKDGRIDFYPIDGQDTQSGCLIEKGEYRIERKNGVKPGKYLVRISSGDGRTPTNEEAGNPGGSTNIISVDRIPEEWNTASKQQIEVKADDPNQFNFEIPKANPRAKR